MRARWTNPTCLACVVGLVVAGCGGSASKQTTATATAPAAKKPAAAQGAHPAAPAKGKAAAKRAAAPKASASKPTTKATAPVKKLATPHPIPIAAARTKLGAQKQWTGTGNQVLGTIALPRSVVVHWTVSGGQFAVADGSGKLAISGKGATGQSFAASGTYSAVKVTANGKWTLTMASLGA